MPHRPGAAYHRGRREAGSVLGDDLLGAILAPPPAVREAEAWIYYDRAWLVSTTCSPSSSRALVLNLGEQGHGLGKALIKDALLRAVRAGQEVGVRAVLIHAESEEARAFYVHLAEFEPAPTDPLHLFLLSRFSPSKRSLSAKSCPPCHTAARSS